MCTATWLTYTDGYELFFNRDEANSRLPGRPPSMESAHSISYIAPSDRNAGGTWIGVNEYGLTLSLLNRYPLTDENTVSELIGPAPDKTSRGHIVRMIIHSTTIGEVARFMEEADLEEFRPFTLLAVDPRLKPRRWTWTGEGGVATIDSPTPPVASSAFRTREVLKTRRKTYENMVREQGRVDSETLTDYHSSHIPERGPFSVCMHRSDGKTQSMSRIVVTADLIRFFYTPGSPCATPSDSAIELSRRK